MRDWIAGIVGEDLATGAMLVVVTAAIVFAFLALFAIFKGFSGTGIRNSRRTRQARLAIMDAAIVDSRRRLVLVRRDEIEHLILIGGPTDVVVEQNIVRSGSSTSVKPAKNRGTVPPAAQVIPSQVPPSAVEEMPATTRPVPISPARAPSIPPPSYPPVERSSPTPSPQIRPATKPPTPQAPVAVAPVAEKRETVSAVNLAEAPRPPSAIAAPPAPAISTPPAPAISTPPTSAVSSPQIQPIAPDNKTTPPTVARRGRFSPVLAQASPSAAAAAAAAPVAAVAASVTPSAPLATPSDSVASTAAPSSEAIAENQLADFEDNLAMNLGETLFTEDDTPSDKTDLANEMDELLSEITSGGRS